MNNDTSVIKKIKENKDSAYWSSSDWTSWIYLEIVRYKKRSIGLDYRPSRVYRRSVKKSGLYYFDYFSLLDRAARKFYTAMWLSSVTESSAVDTHCVYAKVRLRVCMYVCRETLFLLNVCSSSWLLDVLSWISTKARLDLLRPEGEEQLDDALVGQGGDVTDVTVADGDLPQHPAHYLAGAGLG